MYFFINLLLVLFMSVFQLNHFKQIGDIDEHVFDYLQKYGYISRDISFAKITLEELNVSLTLCQQFLGFKDQIEFQSHLNKSRCSEPDIQLEDNVVNRRSKRFALSGKKWLTDPITEKIKLKYMLNGSSSSTVQLVESASKLWTDVADITIESSQTEYSIVFNISDEFKFDYKIKKPRRETDQLIIEINYSQTLKSVKFFNMLVHTLGHGLGLDHSSQSSSVMFPYIEANNRKNLSDDDIAAIQSLYGINAGNPTVNWLNLSQRTDLNASDLCLDPKIDSVLELPDERWMLFKGEHYYEIGPFGQTMNSPRRIKWDFKEVETPIDATLNWNEGILFFFKGNHYWKYQNKKFITYRKISEGFENIPDGPFDDIFKWHINQKTYFFKGDQFWKYDSKTKQKNKYPKKISEYWKGIPNSFDAAISSIHRQQTYFFKDNKYYRFDDINKKVVDSTPHYPRETNLFLLMCRNHPISKESIPKWLPRPLPPKINQNQSAVSPVLSTLPPVSNSEESDDGEGWLIFITVVLGLFIAIIMGTGSYVGYLIFFPQINPENNQRTTPSTNTAQTSGEPIQSTTTV